MHFVPIPTTQNALWETRKYWMPFMPGIADRSDESLDDLIDHIASGRIQIGLVWDEKEQKAHALIGISYRQLGRELVGEVHWATGWGTKEWRHLLPELEKYLKRHIGCTIIKPICRPGWKPFLKQAGYKLTHVVMEKML